MMRIRSRSSRRSVPTIHRAGRLRRRLDDLDALGGEDGVERGGEQSVPVADEVAQRLDPLTQVEEQVAGLLGHPFTGWVGGHPGQVHSPVGDFDEDQDVQPAQQHRLDGEEVAGDDAVGLGGEELPPARPVPPWRRVHTSVVQDRPYCAGRDLVAQSDQLTLDPPVSPARVLRGQPEHQVPDRLPGAWPSWSAARVGPAPGDQVAVPAQHRLRRDHEHRPPRPW